MNGTTKRGREKANVSKVPFDADAAGVPQGRPGSFLPLVSLNSIIGP